MAIKVSGTIVVDDNRNIKNTNVITANTYIGDGSQLTGVSSLPNQTGNANTFLTTNGTSAYWIGLPIAPGPVTNLTATVPSEVSKIVVSWTAPGIQANGYTIYYGLSNPVTIANAYSSIFTTNTTANITSFPAGNNVTYINVIANNSFGNSIFSTQTSATPNAAPGALSDITLIPTGSQTINVVWTTTTGNPTPVYRIYHKTTTGVSNSDTLTVATTSPTTITGLSGSTKYFVKLFANNAFGETSSAEANTNTAPASAQTYNTQGSTLTIPTDDSSNSNTFIIGSAINCIKFEIAGGGGGGGGSWNNPGNCGGKGGVVAGFFPVDGAFGGRVLTWHWGRCGVGGSNTQSGRGGGATALVRFGGDPIAIAAGGGGGGAGGPSVAGVNGGAGGCITTGSGVATANGCTAYVVSPPAIPSGLGGTGTAAGGQPPPLDAGGVGSCGGGYHTVIGDYGAGYANNSTWGSGGYSFGSVGGGGGGYFGGAGAIAVQQRGGGGGGSSYIGCCVQATTTPLTAAGGYGFPFAHGGTTGCVGCNGRIIITFLS